MGLRELGYALVVALVGLVLAALVILAPWYPGHDLPGISVLELVAPGGLAGQP